MKKRILCALLALVLIVSAGFPAANAFFEDMLDLTIYLRNGTNGVLNEDVTVIFTARGSGSTFKHHFTKEQIKNGNPGFLQVDRNKTYDITFEYNSAHTGLFYVCNADGTNIDPFIGGTKNATFGWEIRCVEFGEKPDYSYLEEEAPKVFAAFMEEFNKLDFEAEETKRFVEYFEYNKKLWAKNWTKTTGRTVEEWEAYSLNEQILIFMVYLSPLKTHQDGAGWYDFYFRSLSRYRSYGAVDDVYAMIEKGKWHYSRYEELMAAYDAFTEWMYDYTVKMGKIYNFVPHLLAPDSVTAPTEPEPTVEATRPADPTEPEPTERPTEPQSGGEAPAPSSTAGKWSKVFSVLKENWFTIVLLALAGAGFGVAVFLRKKKNIDDDWG